MENKHYLLALNRIKGVGPRSILNYLKYWPDLACMFKLKASELIKIGISETIAKSIAEFDFGLLDEDYRWQKGDNCQIISWDDENYPKLLKEIYDPPPILYALGNTSILSTPSVAIVGTRKPSVMGSETAWQIAHELARCGITIVSGLALGVDAKAHFGSLAAFGNTVAVMGTGINRIYPFQNTALYHEIRQSGLILSEFPLNSPPNAGHFPRRNRIISGLSSSILVIEAAIRSGSLITARFALEQNRDVLAVPGSIKNPQARGCHQLLQQGAKLVTSYQDVLDELGFDGYHTKLVEKEKPIDTLAIESGSLVNWIGYEVTTVDQILSRSSLSLSDVLCRLAELELQGIVLSVPGGYMRCKL